jgi:hypothetical protein
MVAMFNTEKTYEGIQFLDCEPITKAEWEAGFANMMLGRLSKKQQRQPLKQQPKPNLQHSDSQQTT